MGKYGACPDGFPSPGWSVEGLLEQQETLMIDYSLISQSAPYIFYEDKEETRRRVRLSNEQIAELARGHRGTIGVLAALPLQDTADSLLEISYASEQLEVEGFCVNTNVGGLYLGSPALDPIMEALDAQGALVVIHPAEPGAVPSDVNATLPIPLIEFLFDTTRTVVNMALQNLFVRYPDIKWVVPHAGAFLPAVIDRIMSFPNAILGIPDDQPFDYGRDLHNLYYDVAGYPERFLLAMLLEVADLAHIFFGSDFPYAAREKGRGLAAILEESDKMSDAQKEAIFCKNAASFLGLESS